MDYAINKVTNKIESAEKAFGGGFYVCPICRARVSHCAGLKRKKYFAHYPGTGTFECENFALGQYGQGTFSGPLAGLTKRRMDLRLKIERGQNRAAWYLELTLPSSRACNATVTIDVGGRLQNIDMRGMVNGFRVMAELSTDDFRIVSFEGTPDRFFVESVERECRGLPSLGATVFTASGRGGNIGFPRAHELRGAETYAVLWKEPAFPGFPNELVPERFQSRQGWTLALITIPEAPSEECIEWLQAFTGLMVNPSVPSISTVWPFLARNASVNAVECTNSSSVVLAASMMPVSPGDAGPNMLVFGGDNRISAMGVERSPALFALTPGGQTHFRVAKSERSETEKLFLRTLAVRPVSDLPGLEMGFSTSEGVHLVVPFGTSKCKALVDSARQGQATLEYLAIPPGITGRLHAETRSTFVTVQLAASDIPAHHCAHQRLLSPPIQTIVIDYLSDSSSHIDLEFGGFGRMRLTGSPLVVQVKRADLVLDHLVRSRLRSFLVQLQAGSTVGLFASDSSLVRAFCALRPPPELLPNYRVLASELLACGFEIKHSKGVSL
ncbi:competence protein CoiA family protein [Pseudomonas congelans]|uniref:hypothetical protein n=1 Tax=Pseudomonas congelans TaxID=200452 RepID=UPI0004E2E1F1|nr:hypothetical protein [Pseudomonas congelans]KFE46437.1 hypothetical protein IV03_11800 [Pseudomonas congelans]